MELFLTFSHSNIGRQSQNSVPQTRLKSPSHSLPLSYVYDSSSEFYSSYKSKPKESWEV
jgi:hypothetical protein